MNKLWTFFRLCQNFETIFSVVIATVLFVDLVALRDTQPTLSKH